MAEQRGEHLRHRPDLACRTPYMVDVLTSITTAAKRASATSLILARRAAIATSRVVEHGVARVAHARERTELIPPVTAARGGWVV